MYPSNLRCQTIDNEQDAAIELRDEQKKVQSRSARRIENIWHGKWNNIPR